MRIRCKNCFEEHEDHYDVCPHCGYTDGDAPQELWHLHPGMVLADRYLVGQVLGFGGFGVIYKVWDQNLKTVLAVKEYYPQGLVNRVPGTKEVTLYAQNRRKEYEHGLTRFLDEARSMARFSSHSNIINIFDYFEENSTAYFAMEFLDGISLSKFLKTDEMDVQCCIDVVLQVCAALRDIHAVGIVHRDVSPDNIFLCTNGIIKLIDFGAARFSRDEDSQLTIILKPGYAPPEQYEKINEQGPWTDLYALGATMYHMVTGDAPDESTNRRIMDELVPPQEVNPEVSPQVGNTIMTAMALDRHLRYATIAEFEKGLRGEVKSIPVEKKKNRKKRRRLITFLSASLVVAIIGSIFFTNWNRNRIEETLPDASIELWLPLTGVAEADQAKDKAFKAILENFAESYPNVTVTVKQVPQDSYVLELKAAASRGQMPALFCMDGLSEAARMELADKTADLKDVFVQLDSSTMFVSKYRKSFEEQKRIPLSFHAPVFYLNTTMARVEGNNGVEDAGELVSILSQTEQKMVVGPRQQPMFLSAYGDTVLQQPGVVADDAQEQFFNGGVATYFADSSEYFRVQAALPARYRLLYVNTDKVPGLFSDYWSIGQVKENQLRAAKRLLAFLYSDNAQDQLFIQARGGSLPLNRNVLNVFCEVYTEFAGFFKNIDDYQF